jgi:RND superfamily putative drug exporter
LIVIEEEQRIAHTGALAAIAGHCARHPWRVVFTWISIFVVLIGLNAAFHGKLINDFKIPGSDTQKATDLITAKFGGQKGAALRVVLASKDGRPLDSEAHAAAVHRMLVASAASQRSLAEDPTDVSAITNPLSSGSTQLADSGKIAYFDVQYDRTGFELPRSGVVSVEDQLRSIADAAGMQVEFTGEAESAPPTQGLSDIIGLVAAFVILMVLFRALVPTMIPLLFAITAVLGAFLILFLAARLTHFNTITEILVPMIGLGVGIDYTLFIVTRFRQFLHDGLSPQDAAAAAGATAGRAVIFAGVTVAISITGLALIGLDFITKLGIGSALGVLTAVLLANSLLPAVLSLLGGKIDRGRLGLRPVDESRAGQARTPVAAWGRFVSRNAKIVLPVVLVVLLLLASPILAVRLGLADSGTAPKDQTTRKAYDLLSSGFGPGFTEPIPVVIDMQSDHAAATKLETALKAVPGLAEVDKPIYNKKKTALATVAIVNSYGKYKPQDSKTDDLVTLLRHTVIPRTLAGSTAHAYVSGSNAAFTDIGHRIFSHSPWFLLYIIGITFLVLAMAFRSAVIAIESFVPPIAFAILFGLSMDYEVFLMSRIREERVHGDNTVDAVKDGVAAVGRVIVAAALIMSSVFFSFLLSPDRVSKEFGLVLGVAILTDALLMRLTLVPALLTVLRGRSWWIPGWLEKILPNITIESPGARAPAELPPRTVPADVPTR